MRTDNDENIEKFLQIKILVCFIIIYHPSNSKLDKKLIHHASDITS